MKKLLCLTIITVAMMFSLVACGNDDKKTDTTETVSVQDDLVEFINVELAPILTYRDTAIESYNSYFKADSMDKEAFLSELKVAAIPNMEDFITNLEAIEVSTDEVAALKDLYLQSARKQLEAMNLVKDAILDENPDYLEQADALIREADSLLAQYETDLKALCNDYNIDISGSF